MTQSKSLGKAGACCANPARLLDQVRSDTFPAAAASVLLYSKADGICGFFLSPQNKKDAPALAQVCKYAYIILHRRHDKPALRDNAANQLAVRNQATVKQSKWSSDAQSQNSSNCSQGKDTVIKPQCTVWIVLLTLGNKISA